MISFTFRHGPRTFAAALLIVVLCVVDAYLTIDLEGCGAEELNPIKAYYLKQSPLLSFVVKYLIASNVIMMILISANHYIGGMRVQSGLFLAAFFILPALAVQWQLFLIYGAGD